MDKEKMRMQFNEVSILLNMAEICREANVDRSNYVKFSAGHLGHLSTKKIQNIIDVINRIKIEE